MLKALILLDSMLAELDCPHLKALANELRLDMLREMVKRQERSFIDSPLNETERNDCVRDFSGKIDAIKSYKNRTGNGLTYSLKVVEDYMQNAVGFTRHSYQ